MSFILDALRKSEARRKAGEVPGIDTETARSGRRPQRSVRFGLVVLLVPLCAVVLAAGVYLLRPQWLPEGLVQTESPEPQPETVVVPDVDETDLADEDPGEHALAQIEPIDETIGDADLGEDAAAEDDEPAPVDRRRALQPATGQAVTRAAPERERVVEDHDEAMAEIERRVAETRSRVEQASEDDDRRSRDVPVADRERDRRARPDDAAEPVAEIETTDDWRPQAAEYVRAWELPLSVRRSLPELKLTIHVFSAEEGGRFVLINGERYVPGDQLIDGARLVDIRREGAIVDFREHRFLLEP